MSKSQVSLTDDTVVAYPGDEGTTAGGADDVHGNVDAKEALPPKNLTLAKGKRRAQVTNTANHANEASARKCSASQSLHISDQDLDEAYNEEPLEIANNIDELQEELLAARLSIVSVLTLSVGFLPMLHDIPPMRAMALCYSLSNSWAHVHLAGGHTSMGAYERHLIKGVSLFIENIEAARCVLLAPHQIPLKEFTRLRKKSDLHPVWGFPSVQPENTSSVAHVTGSAGIHIDPAGPSGPGPAESFLQDEVHHTRDRIYAIKIALDIGLGGLATTQFGKPTALMSYVRTWTLSVARLGSSTGGLTAESQLPP
ncbi:ATP-binding cassette (ABC) Superfamily [Phytophthora palmivora]|uniref:ATP-binding cassette (ABC) Superfamily n=1 Tax=Phytophthora palmivora TaxID=4796 RepID=A0A2P4XT59_9STRA|nr:ATP-binding cassette (ABC) Superfamily [Phytophthora palmivora]